MFVLWIVRTHYFEKELREAVARFVVADASGQLVNALPALDVSGAVKQHALQGFNYRDVFFLPQDVGAVHALAAQIRVAVVILLGVHAVAAVGADFVHDAADAHDLVGVVVHFQNEQRRFIRDIGLDGHGAFVNALVFGVRRKPRGSLGPGCIAVPGDANCERLIRVQVQVRTHVLVVDSGFLRLLLLDSKKKKFNFCGYSNKFMQN